MSFMRKNYNKHKCSSLNNISIFKQQQLFFFRQLARVHVERILNIRSCSETGIQSSANICTFINLER